jgi:hypothetical protein
LKWIAPILWSVVVLAVVGGSAAVTWHLVQADARPGDGGVVVVDTSNTSPYITPGRDYYLWVRLIELTPRTPKGKQWDYGGSGPDIRFKLWWQGNKIYESEKRDDTLIGKWDLIAADLLEMVRTQKIEIERAIRMPIVRVDHGMTIGIDVVDVDVSYNEEAGRFLIELDKLKPGINVLPGPEGSGIVRVEVQAIDARIPLSDLIDLVTAR